MITTKYTDRKTVVLSTDFLQTLTLKFYDFIDTDSSHRISPFDVHKFLVLVLDIYYVCTLCTFPYIFG